jgi:hypothetical protein
MIHQLQLHPTDQPLFSLAVRAAGGAFTLRVNDVPVFAEAAGASLNFVMPVNEWLFQGENRVELEVDSLVEEAGALEVTLEYRRLRQPLRLAISLGTLVYSASEKPEKVPPPAPEAREITLAQPGHPTELEWEAVPTFRRPGGTVVAGGVFQLPAPWPVCPWKEGAELHAEDNLQPAIFQLTQSFHDLLSRRDHTAMLRLAGVRCRGLEQAYSLFGQGLEEALLYPVLLRQPGWRAVPLPAAASLRLEIAGNRRLVRLVTAGTGESPLRLENEAEDLEAVISAWWGFTTGWVLMR